MEPAAQDPTADATAPDANAGDESGGAATDRDAPDPDVAAPDPAPGDAPAASTGAGEDLKARYREALAHKHGSSGVNRAGHGDKGMAAHPQDAHPGERMFRRKAGG